MIRGLHGMFYSSQADELRAFLRDKLGLPFSDVGGGWLIFDVPEADIGVHPVDDPSHSGTHDISFYCDDIDGTVAELRARGVEFDGEVQNQGWGSSINLVLPGGVRVGLYQPRYQKSAKKAAPAARAKKSVAARPAAAKSVRRKAPATKKKAPAKRPTVKRAGKRRR
ncbi:MAG TPA: VOC family protein [Kofleriaceae bacterium]|nr:VOC family protein [Kofleriaceae bacterium]